MGMQNAYADGNVDQETVPFIAPGQYFIQSFEQRGQVFIPTADNLIAIDLGLFEIVAPTPSEIEIDDTFNISIHLGNNPASLKLSPFASRIGTVTSIDGDTKHLHLNSPVALVPGDPYILELEFSGSTVKGKSGGAGYADANSVVCFGTNPCITTSNDLSFRTYFQPSIPIGGTVGSMDTVSLLVAGAQANMGWWSLALVGMVAAGAAITYKLKSKKTKE